MKAIDTLLELLNRVGTCQGKAVKAMKSQKLIVRAKPASSAICPGCERNCVMPVHSLSATIGKTSSFIVCDKRSDVNRVLIPAERLSQWRCNADLACRFISTSLALRQSVKKADDVRWEIGMVSGDKHSQMLYLKVTDELILIAGNSKVPLAEFIEFHEGAYSLDAVQIRRLADSATTADDRYTPSNARREARKLDTKAMYESWRKAYRELRREKPGMHDVWYSLKIAKLDIAQGRKAETIRKKMKT
ncbi:hypothetical protein ER57_16410 [Smithella sp. SCADC]|jgi:hypothetical protein|nr:hypothetical protein ER57_16410 [Smithella sp. SCADC]